MRLEPRDLSKTRIAQLYNKYRLRAQDFCDIYNEQKGGCAICFKYLNDPCVDHDPYKTGRKYGQVRGLLCYIKKQGSGLQESRMLRDSGTVTQNVT